MRAVMMTQKGGGHATYNQWTKTLNTKNKSQISYKKKRDLFGRTYGSGANLTKFEKIGTKKEVVIKWGQSYNSNTLQTEYKLLRNLQHNHIIKPEGYGTYSVEQGGPTMTHLARRAIFSSEKNQLDSNPGHYLVLPKYHKDLVDIARCGQLPQAPINDDIIKLLTFMEQMLDALVYLKEKQILHDDIKPDNILVDKYGDYVLADFGSARKVGEDRRSITCEYAAPEIYKSTPYRETQSDIFSLAATCYKLTTGEFMYKKGQKYNDPRIAVPLDTVKEKLEHCLYKEDSISNTLRRYTNIAWRGSLNPKRTPDENIDKLVGLLIKMLSQKPENRPTPKDALEQVQALRMAVELKITEKTRPRYAFWVTNKIQPLDSPNISRSKNKPSAWSRFVSNPSYAKIKSTETDFHTVAF